MASRRGTGGSRKRKRIAAEVILLGRALFENLLLAAEANPQRQAVDEGKTLPVEDLRHAGNDFFAALCLLLNVDDEEPDVALQGNSAEQMPLSPDGRLPPERS